MFTIGMYKTRALAEAAAQRWEDVYNPEEIEIIFDGTFYLVRVPAE